MSIGVYLVTDPIQCSSRGITQTVKAAVKEGVKYVQLRDKTATDAELLHQLEQLAKVIQGQAKLLVDDRLDLVVEALKRGIPVDGVHLGQTDTDVRIAREQLGNKAIIGLTANTSAHLEALSAFPAGTVNYLGVGVIHPSSTKPDHPAPLGVNGFASFTARAPLPTVAIGGITVTDVPALRAAGASGIAVVSEICAASDPQQAARALVAAWDKAA